MNRGYAYRRHKRSAKAARRMAEDRAQHGNPQRGVHSRRVACACFEPDGRTVARFADHPAVCSSCCGNRRPWDGPTMQERRSAASEGDWAA